MKARKLFAALGAGLILACCVMIYLMLDVTLFPQSRGSKSNVKDVSILVVLSTYHFNFK